MKAVVFLDSQGDRHAQVIGGLTALERRIREVAREGATRAIVAATPVAIARPLPIPVEYVAPGSAAPEGAKRERADVVAGIELVDATACDRAEWALLRSMGKSFQGPVDALINWRFSNRITRVLARRSLALTPNHVTLSNVVVGLAACAVATGGSYVWFALAGVLLETQSILDSVDGELARLRYQFSKLGQWLDNVSDDLIDNLLVVGVGVGLGGVWLWLALAGAIARWVVAAYVYISVYRRTGTGDVFAHRWWFEVGAPTVDALYDPKALSTWLRSFGRRDTYVFLWMVTLVAGLPYWVIFHELVIAAVYVGLVVLHHTVFRARWATSR